MSFSLEQLTRLTRRQKVTLQLCLDAGLVVLCVLASLAIRLDNVAFVHNPRLWLTIVTLVPLTLGLFAYFNVYRYLVRYLTGRSLASVAKATLLSGIAMFIIGHFLEATLPRSVPLIYAILLFLSVGGARFVARHLFRREHLSSRVPAIIYGAGTAGLELLNALFHSRDYKPVAFIDDAHSLQGFTVGGVEVHSPRDIQQIIQKTGCRHVFLAIPSATRLRRKEIIAELGKFDLQIKTIPEIADLVSGRAKISEVRNVGPEDLLGRDPIAPDPELLTHNIRGKVVLVSGAGGSIGSELCRQILAIGPTKLVLYEISEFALYTIDAELRELTGEQPNGTEIVSVLGSVQDARQIENIMISLGVQTVYHAAAYKHVPMVEENVVEGIRNNVFGTLAMASTAHRLGVESFILISTDKAVRPTNVMGATKRLAELICQSYASENSKTLFSMVRFGNVLGSSGSVIPRFKAQIERGGPVTVTHPEITRYFMTIPEASQLVLQAGALAQGGDVFVLDMGQPVKILDLAIETVKLYGLEPYLIDNADQSRPEQGDIAIRITGLRRGEKLYEELLIGGNPRPTRHPRILTASEISMPMCDLMPVLHKLRAATEHFNSPLAIALLCQLPLGYTPAATASNVKVDTSDLLNKLRAAL